MYELFAEDELQTTKLLKPNVALRVSHWAVVFHSRALTRVNPSSWQYSKRCTPSWLMHDRAGTQQHSWRRISSTEVQRMNDSGSAKKAPLWGLLNGKQGATEARRKNERKQSCPAQGVMRGVS